MDHNTYFYFYFCFISYSNVSHRQDGACMPKDKYDGGDEACVDSSDVPGIPGRRS